MLRHELKGGEGTIKGDIKCVKKRGPHTTNFNLTTYITLTEASIKLSKKLIAMPESY